MNNSILMCIRVLFASKMNFTIGPLLCALLCLVCVCVVASYWKALSDFTSQFQINFCEFSHRKMEKNVQQWALCCRLCDTKSIEVKMLWMINRQQKHIEALLYQTWHQLYVCGCVYTISRHTGLSLARQFYLQVWGLCVTYCMSTNTHTLTHILY